MPQQLVRLGDPVFCPADVHGFWPVPVTGWFTSGSPNTFTNDLPAVRVGDGGPHVACAGPNLFVASSGSPNCFINDLPAVRTLDVTTHCGVSPGFVKALLGSPNSFVN